MSTRQDFLRIATAAARAVQGSKLDAASVRKPGSTMNIVAAMGSALAEEVDARNAERIAARVTAAARGNALDVAILELTYGLLPRKGASAATATIGLSRASTGEARVLPAGTIVVLSGVQFAVDAPGASFGAGEGGNLVVKPLGVTAVATGSAGNVPVSTPSFADPGLLTDSTFRLSALPNASPGEPSESQATGGDERETDTAYLARFRLYASGQRRGLDLLEAGGLSADGVVKATAVEELNQYGRITGRVFLFVADVNGRAGASLIDRVEVKLRGFRLQGQDIVVRSSSPTLLTMQLSFAVRVGFDIGSVRSAAMTSAILYTNELNPGESWYRAGVASRLVSVPGLVFSPAYPFGVVSPATDVIASPSTLFRTTAELVSTL
jgi:hypothetical protein